MNVEISTLAIHGEGKKTKSALVVDTMEAIDWALSFWILSIKDKREKEFID